MFYAILLCTISLTAFSQDDEVQEKKIVSPLLVNGKLPIDSFYQDKTELLVYSKIVMADSIKKDVLLKKVKNWAGIQFVNLKEVLVSETDDQLVLNYIDNSYYVKNIAGTTYQKYYIRLVIQFKDGKVKFTFYDDGNVAVINTYVTISARTYHLKDAFKEKDSQLMARNGAIDGLISIKNNLIKTCTSAETYISKREKSTDW